MRKKFQKIATREHMWLVDVVTFIILRNEIRDVSLTMASLSSSYARFVRYQRSVSLSSTTHNTAILLYTALNNAREAGALKYSVATSS